ncbi:bifunctional diguanylate cyclase/phosphodiesterase [Demequina sp. NBRC 110055]|uniref:putative bifunctional diguanylate cyclase/phosphodiesterase n=1 Tax=Demequina sp. NBRC 110055 TaxID=1570344 RepID=UPI0009FDE828|nr:EAL domain-containing protein [Demequina sp. NBRC 110055]
MNHDAEVFAGTFRDSPLAMAVLDADGRLRDANPALSTLLGRPLGFLVGTALGALAHPDDRDQHRQIVAHVSRGTDERIQAQVRCLHASGDTLWTRMTVARLGDATGSLITYVEDLTEVRRARELVEHHSNYDLLTGLANRTLLLDRLSVALQRSAASTACIFLDLDHFKIINDSLGHEAGDLLLVEIATRLQAAVRPGDIVARLGGDEFVVVLEDMDEESATSTMRALVAAVREPVMIATHEVVPTVSAGVSVGTPRTTAETLVRDADIAMSRAKAAGRDRVEVFSEEYRDDAFVRLSIESELRVALREGQLEVHYQPVVDMDSRQPVAYEALVRWRHPQRGLLLPDSFIEVGEEANLIIPLGEFVLDEACHFIASRPSFSGKVLVNVSTRQIGVPDLTGTVTRALARHGVAPSRLALEITESGMLVATQAALTDLRGIADLGVELLLDDFGTGYSALSSVLRSPVTGLKLAREFTLRLGDRSTGDRISTAVASLVDSLGMHGIIEGVETESQYRQARAQGWKLAQGFLFGRPTPAELIPGALTAPRGADAVATPSTADALGGALPAPRSAVDIDHDDALQATAW